MPRSGFRKLRSPTRGGSSTARRASVQTRSPLARKRSSAAKSRSMASLPRKSRSTSQRSPAARTASAGPAPSARQVFARMAAGQKRLGLAKQARAGVDALWLTGRLGPKERARKLREVDDAERRFEALVEAVVERGKLRDWNARSERELRTAEQWADAFSMLLDVRNLYERIYRGPPVFSPPELTPAARRELKAHCRAREPSSAACGPPCRVTRGGLLRRKRCAGPKAP